MQNGTDRRGEARERLRQALVALAAHGTASGIKGPEAGEPASGQGPSEPRGWSELDSSGARPSGTEGREEDATPPTSRTTASS